MSLKDRSGFALLEVLVTLVILTLGMVGIAAMLFFSHKAGVSSFIKQQAIQSTYNIIDRMRANRQAVINGNYRINNLVTSGSVTFPTTSTDCSQTTCSSSQLASYDTWYWLAKELSQLPDGCGSISTVSNSSTGETVVTVTVQWDDSPAQDLLGATGTTVSGNTSIVRLSVETLL